MRRMLLDEDLFTYYILDHSKSSFTSLVPLRITTTHMLES